MFAVGVAAAGVAVGYGVYSYLKQKKKQVAKNVIDYMMEEIANANVFVRDPVGLRDKLQIFLEGGAEKMQCISDFDGTLTRAMFNGEKAMTSFGVVARSTLMPDEVETKEIELRKKYYPIERSSEKSKEEKSKAMEEWWQEIFCVMKEGGFRKEMIPEMVENGTSVLREGGSYVLEKLCEKKIPLLVFSAGLGDVVREVIEQQASKLDNMTIISNFVKWDEEGKMLGISGSDILHSSNKGEFAASLSYRNSVEGRANILLLGDNEGDSEMLKAIDHVHTSLNIGFLNDNVNELRRKFENLYDIVIVDPESMVLVGVLMMKLLDGY